MSSKLDLQLCGTPNDYTCIIAGSSQRVVVNPFVACEDRRDGYFPAVIVTFDELELMHLRPLFRTMKKVGCPPILHFVRNEGGQLETVMRFSVPYPSVELTRRMCQLICKMGFPHPVKFCKEMRLDVRSPITPKELRNFVYSYADRHHIKVFVHNEMDVRDSGFLVTSFYRDESVRV